MSPTTKGIKNIILLQSYAGMSDYVFECKCTGRKLGMVELERLGLFIKEHQRLSKNSDYIMEWYEVGFGDVITITKWPVEIEKDHFEWIKTTIEITCELLDPPQLYNALPRDIIEYLKKAGCTIKEEPVFPAD